MKKLTTPTHEPYAPVEPVRIRHVAILAFGVLVLSIALIMGPGV